MTTTVQIGKRLIPLDSIALIEPFDQSAHPGMKSEKAFKARIVLIDRQSVLTEETAEAFAAAHSFRMLPEDGVATNPLVHSFGAESFAPSEGFEPSKPFVSRLTWKDRDGNTQSKLLLSKPETVLAIAVKGEAEPPAAAAEPPGRGGNGRKPTASIDRRRARGRADHPTPP